MARADSMPIIGRATERDRLRTAISAAVASGPRVVFLVGEAGIGKTRLLDEAMRQPAGTRVALGRCLDERGMPPYLPWIDALADLDESAKTRSAAPSGSLEPGVASLRDLLLGANAELLGIGSIGGPSPEQRKLRLFDRVTRTLIQLAREAPTMIAFDDLQWSDDASNELLRYVAVHLPPVPLVIVGAFRSEEAVANAGLTRTIAELNRRRLLTTIRVAPLAPTETADLLTGLLGYRNADLAMMIHRHSEGNPFFIEEVVRALIEDRRPGDAGPDDVPVNALWVQDSIALPQGVVAVIQHRLGRVSAPCRAMLEHAALAGREISVDLIAGAMDLSAERVIECCNEAVGAALIRPGAPDEIAPVSRDLPSDFVFLHDRVRESLDAGIDPVRRRVCHTRLAAALEMDGRHADDLPRLAALTHHFQRAREDPRAAHYAERLGDASMRIPAHAEAVRAYRLAADLAPTSSAPTALAAQGNLLLKLGRAALATSGADALDAFAAAERTYADIGDRSGAAHALHGLGMAYARREQYDLAITYLEAAVAAQDEAAGASAEALIDLAAILGDGLARYDDAIAVGRRALDLAQQSGCPPAREAQARLALGRATIVNGGLAEGKALVEPALSLALQAGALDLAADIAGTLANHASWAGDLDVSERFARQRREFAVRAGDPFALRHTLTWLAVVALARGNWGDAERLLTEAEEEVHRIDSPEPLAFLRHIAGWIAFWRGRYDESVAMLTEAIAGFRVSGAATLAWYLGCLAHAHIAAGDVDAGQRVAAETAEIVAALPAGSLPRAPALAQLGLIIAGSDDVAAARQWYHELLPYAGQWHWVLVDRVLGVLATVIGDPDAAERHFAAARSRALQGGFRSEFALLTAERAALRLRLAAPEQRTRAEQELRRAIAQVAAFDMMGEVTRLEAAHLLSDSISTADYPAGLTTREVEVLRLLAQGLTNREIGARLFISEKTVTNHLTHIFMKADIENRASAVTFAHRHGLA